MSPAGEAYLRWYYDSQVWKHLNYRGVRILKNPLDLWNYQEIFQQHARRSPGRVISVDVDHLSLQVASIPSSRSCRATVQRKP